MNSYQLIAKLKAAKETGKMLVSPEQMSRMMDIGARLERLNHDEPNSISKVKEEIDFSSFSVEEMLQLKDLLQKSSLATS